MESETDQGVKANKAMQKVYRKICEEDLHLEPLCDEVINNCFRKTKNWMIFFFYF
jgi:hypothetical protein